jgi:hypothetical protein
MKEYFRFSADSEKDRDVINYLKGLPKVFRGEAIIAAVRFLLENMGQYISKRPEG